MRYGEARHATIRRSEAWQGEARHGEARRGEALKSHEGGFGMARKLEAVVNAANDGQFVEPYVVEVEIEGTADLLFHRWSNEAVEEKSKAAKNSKSKKEDNVESYVYRNTAGELCIPGEYLRQAIVHAAKYRQDPRSPRKSAMDLYKAGIVSLTDLSSLGVKEWDYLDRRRVTIQRNGVTRVRPAMLKGWRAAFLFQVMTPEYIEPQDLNATIQQAGRLVGIGDFRPTYGRFVVIRFETMQGVEEKAS